MLKPEKIGLSCPCCNMRLIITQKKDEPLEFEWLAVSKEKDLVIEVILDGRSIYKMTTKAGI